MSLPITAIVTFHHEGALAHPTLASVAAAVDQAAADGVDTEVLLVLDRPDDATRAMVRRSAGLVLPTATISESDHGDQAGSRNEAIAAASHGLVALMDGDDLMGKQWLSGASRALTLWGPGVVVHPSLCLMFRDQPTSSPTAWIIQDSRSPDFNFSMLAQQNAWPACVALYRETAVAVPFVKTPNAEGFAAEDLHWNLTLLGKGIHHAPAPQTSYFYRIRGHGSNVRKGRPIRPVTVLRDPEILRSLGRFEASGTTPAPRTQAQEQGWFHRAGLELLALSTLPERRLIQRLTQRRKDESSRPDQASVLTEPWFLADVDGAARIEPRLATAMGHNYLMGHVTNQADPFSDLYWEFVDFLGVDQQHLVIGDDAASIDQRAGDAMILTSGAGVGRVAVLGKKLVSLNDPHFSADRLVALLVTQLTPATLSIYASSTAWGALLRWGLSMSQSTKITVVIRTRDLGDSGRLNPVEALRIREVADFCHAVVTETPVLAALLTEVYGIDEGLVSVQSVEGES